MLEYDKPGQLYKTTKKGFQFLELYKQMEELVKQDRFTILAPRNIGDEIITDSA